MSSIGRTSTPGACMSMMNVDKPLCLRSAGLVRATMMPTAALCASEVQIFEPLIT